MKALKVSKLPINSVVHHTDKDETNVENTNLVLCEDQEYHFLLHHREDALKACGHANWRRCRICQRYDKLKNLILYTFDRHAEHAECRNRYATKQYYDKPKGTKRLTTKVINGG